MVERLSLKQVVRGSIPLISTKRATAVLISKARFVSLNRFCSTPTVRGAKLITESKLTLKRGKYR